jgi:hypothetical protein
MDERPSMFGGVHVQFHDAIPTRRLERLGGSPGRASGEDGSGGFNRSSQRAVECSGWCLVVERLSRSCVESSRYLIEIVLAV